MRGRELVERQRRIANLGGKRCADRALGLREGNILIVRPERRLRGRREQRLRQAFSQLQPWRQGDAAHRAGLLVVLPARTDEIAPHDGFERQCLKTAHDHCPPFEHGALVRIGHCTLERLAGQMVRDDVASAVEPEV